MSQTLKSGWPIIVLMILLIIIYTAYLSSYELVKNNKYGRITKISKKPGFEQANEEKQESEQYVDEGNKIVNCLLYYKR